MVIMRLYVLLGGEVLFCFVLFLTRIEPQTLQFMAHALTPEPNWLGFGDEF